MSDKEYFANRPFSSPMLGNVKTNDPVVIDEGLGDQMAEAGLLREGKPMPEPVKEVKPAAAAKKKATK